jgi:dTDP-4-dehydrorhamnose reductase
VGERREHLDAIKTNGLDALGGDFISVDKGGAPPAPQDETRSGGYPAGLLRVVNDQFGCPTFADDLAHALISAAARYEPGLYHLAGTGHTTWYGFAREIFAGHTTPDVEPITTADYPTPAKRPANSVLDCTKARTVLGVELPHWTDGLKRMISMLDAT